MDAGWVRDTPPTRARARNSRNVVAIDLHVSELRNARRFGFSLLSVDLNAAAEGAVAVDVAPNDFSYWGYALANRPALVLRRDHPHLQAEPASGRDARSR